MKKIEIILTLLIDFIADTVLRGRILSMGGGGGGRKYSPSRKHKLIFKLGSSTKKVA